MSFVLATDDGAFCDRYDIGQSGRLSLQSKKITDGSAFCDRSDLGRPVVAPTNDIEIVAFVYRPNKDLYLTLHNKKETCGGLPSACLHLAFVQ